MNRRGVIRLAAGAAAALVVPATATVLPSPKVDLDRWRGASEAAVRSWCERHGAALYGATGGLYGIYWPDAPQPHVHYCATGELLGELVAYLEWDFRRGHRPGTARKSGARRRSG